VSKEIGEFSALAFFVIYLLMIAESSQFNKRLNRIEDRIGVLRSKIHQSVNDQQER